MKIQSALFVVHIAHIRVVSTTNLLVVEPFSFTLSLQAVTAPIITHDMLIVPTAVVTRASYGRSVLDCGFLHCSAFVRPLYSMLLPIKTGAYTLSVPCYALRNMSTTQGKKSPCHMDIVTGECVPQ